MKKKEKEVSSTIFFFFDGRIRDRSPLNTQMQFSISYDKTSLLRNQMNQESDGRRRKEEEEVVGVEGNKKNSRVPSGKLTLLR